MRPIIFSLIAVLSMPAVAQEYLRIDREPLYVSDPAACQALEKNGLDAWMEYDFLTLDFDNGIQSMEFHCDFFDVKAREGKTQLFINAVCQLPGEVYPDVLAVSPYNETQILVVSAFDAAMAAAGQYEVSGEVAVPGATLYTRCDNLSEIPVD